jgi:predicted acylesterase/phospholipase RssA
MGYSIGVINGAALAFGRFPEALAHWRRLDGSALKLRPRLSPFSLCSPDGLRSFFDAERDDASARRMLKTDLTVVTACVAEGAALNARYAPGGKEWDAPFIEHAAASCAIPVIFPPVDVDYRGRRVRLYDGGVPMRAPLDFSPLARCADLLVLEMVRADEMGRRALAPWRAVDQAGREAGRRLVDKGLDELLLRAERPPRVFRLAPSRRLEPMMLDFRAPALREMLALGARDASALLAEPSRFRTL